MNDLTNKQSNKNQSRFNYLSKLTPRDVRKSIPRATWYIKLVKSPEVRVFDLP